MEQIAYLLKFVFCAFVIAIVAYRIRARFDKYMDCKIEKENKYFIMHKKLETIIKTWQVNEKSYYAILGFFGNMYELQGKTKWMIERTHALYCNFRRDYLEISERIKREENEFAPEEIFNEYDNQ